MGVGSLGGAVVAAVTVGFLPIPPLLAQSLAMLVAGIVCSLSSMISSSTGLYFFITAYAFLTNSLAALGGPALLIVIEKEQLPHATGQLLLIPTIAVVVGPPAGG